MTGHGHVVPREDGSRARCGGPGICGVCSREAAQELNALRAERDALREAAKAAVEAFESHLTTMSAINADSGYPFSQPLIAAQEKLAALKAVGIE